MSKKAENWHRRHAIQLAAQLPEDAEDARVVLLLIKELLEGYLVGRATPPEGKLVAAFPLRHTAALKQIEPLDG